jgi:hypothetical protein
VSKSGKAAAHRKWPVEVQNGMQGVRRGDGTFKPFARTSKLKPPKAPFAMVNLDEAMAAYADAGTPGALLWPLLLYLHYEAGGAPFPLSNDRLRQYGVPRTTKRRLLARWAKSGLISLEQKGQESVRVTVLARRT